MRRRCLTPKIPSAASWPRPKSIEVRTPQFVFPGLGPGIHERLLVDGRAKPGQDAAGVVRFYRISLNALYQLPSAAAVRAWPAPRQAGRLAGRVPPAWASAPVSARLP